MDYTLSELKDPNEGKPPQPGIGRYKTFEEAGLGLENYKKRFPDTNVRVVTMAEYSTFCERNKDWHKPVVK